MDQCSGRNSRRLGILFRVVLVEGVVWRIRYESAQALRIVRSIPAANPSQVGHIGDGHASQNNRRDRHDDVKSSHVPSFEPLPRFTLNKIAHSTVLSQCIPNHAFCRGPFACDKDLLLRSECQRERAECLKVLRDLPHLVMGQSHL